MHSMSCSLNKERFSLFIKFHLIQCLLCIQQLTKLSPSNLKQDNKLNIVRCTRVVNKSFTAMQNREHTQMTVKPALTVTSTQRLLFYVGHALTFVPADTPYIITLII